MMLAKLNYSPITTQISSVTTMATSKGTKVNATSVQRRNVANKMRAMDATDQMPA